MLFCVAPCCEKNRKLCAVVCCAVLCSKVRKLTLSWASGRSKSACSKSRKSRYTLQGAAAAAAAVQQQYSRYSSAAVQVTGKGSQLSSVVDIDAAHS